MGILSGKFTRDVLCRVVYNGNKQDVDVIEALTNGRRRSPVEISFSADVYFIGKILPNC